MGSVVVIAMGAPPGLEIHKEGKVAAAGGH